MHDVRDPRLRPGGPQIRPLQLALAGNPNVGKSSLFNALTGGHQHVGNWPGKTVERRSGECRLASPPVTVVDLPGTYSLAACSPEEVVAEAALSGRDVDVVVAVLDSTNLERNLYLAAQLAELGRPLVLVLNMADRAAAEGFEVDAEALSAAFGAPVVRTVARTGEGIPGLLDAAARAAPGGPPVRFGAPVEAELDALEALVAPLTRVDRVRARWVAVKLLEGDPDTTARAAALPGGGALVDEAVAAAARVEERTGVPPALAIADRRFAWVHELAAAVVTRRPGPTPATDRIDDVLTSRWAGIPIFLILMWLVFAAVAGAATPLVATLDRLLAGPVRGAAVAVLTTVGLGETWVAAALVDGGLAGAGAVLAFVPVLALLYLALGVLEDSGYMARAAFLMDRLMRPIGLNGKSFLPLLIGFGCNVPGVYAARVLDRPRDRVITSLLMPFVSCAARLPVYVLLAAAFFPTARGTVVFGMYVASIVVVLLVGALLDRLLPDAAGRTFVLELPAYRRPAARVLATYVWQRLRAFLRRAGTVILVSAIVVWTLLAIPASGGARFAEVPLADSAFASVARIAAPGLAPAGLGSWEVAGTLMTGVVAKEVVVSTLGQVYPDAGARRGEEGPSGSSLQAGLDAASGGHGAAAAAALLAFVLLYVPCLGTVAAIRQELGGRWALASIGLNLVVAWSVAVLVFQVGRLVAGAG